MPDFLVFLAPFYIVAFCLLFFLPGWRSLIVGALSAYAVADWTFGQLLFAGPEIIASGPIVLCVALGFVSGFCGRAIVLIARPLQHRLLKPVVIGPVVFVLTPLLLVGYAHYAERALAARFAPPSAACTSRLHSARIADMSLALPLAPIISVGEGFDFQPAYRFGSNEDARNFCSRTERKPPDLTNLHMDFQPFHQQLAIERSAFCQTLQPYDWWKYACLTNPPKPHPLRELTLYAIDEYDARRLTAFSVDEYTQFATRREKMKYEDRRGEFSKYIDGGDIYWSNAGRKSSAPALTRCHRAAQEEHSKLYCMTGYRLSQKIGLTYDFLTSEESFDTQARRVDGVVRHIVQSLRAATP